MQHPVFKRLMCVLLSAVLLTAMLAGCTGEEPITAVYAASDFQPYRNSSDDPEKGRSYMEAIIQGMKKDGYTIQSALICGDYSKTGNTWKNVDPALNNAGLSAVAGVLEQELGLTHDDTVYVQGNHDPADTVGLDPFGANDTDHYGVFVIHEDHYQWKQGVTGSTGNDGTDAKAAAEETAAALERYLETKLEEKYEKPIFVCSHVPLHYSHRTAAMSSQDNIHAKLLFDVLSEYGKHLSIIFLFGHNHSDSDDDYLGGGSVYLSEGDTVLIADAEDYRSFGQYTLNFTYMNAGYLGYYDGNCAGSGLSSTVFAVYDDRVEIARYTYTEEDGEGGAALSPIKEAGVWDKTHANGSFQSDVENTDVYKGVQTVRLKKFSAE